MKKYSFLGAALSMMAALMMTACSNDDNANESPAQQNVAKTIPYTVTVNGGASTRATVQSDNKTLYFADGDKLYVSGTNIKGVLDIQTGDGSTTGPGTASATFSGDLTYSGSGSPASDLSLTATLVSAQQTVGTSAGCQVSVNDAGEVTVNYPTTVYCADVASAVQKFSNLTGTSTYSSKSFSLTQQTAFLNFEISFADGTGITAGANLSTVVNNNGNTICGGNVTATNDGGVIKAKFVLPVAASTATVTKTLTSAYVKFNSDDSKVLRLRDVASLEGKVYNVKPAQSSTLASVTASHLGWLVGSDGKAYDPTKGYMPIGVTAVAKICYLGSETAEADNGFNHGLALALSDANGGGGCLWCTSTGNVHTYKAANSSSFASESGLQYNAKHNSEIDYYPAFKAAIANNGTAAPTDCSSWFLASGYQWKQMIGATGLNNLGLTGNAYYWSSTERDNDSAWIISTLDGSNWGSWGSINKDEYSWFSLTRVRACLAF